MSDLFSSSVVVPHDFNARVLIDQPLAKHDCCYDIYYPADSAAAPPVVLMVTGFADFNRKQDSGKGLKDLPPYQSWGRLLASEGIATVIASCSDPAQDLGALLLHLENAQQQLQLDMERLALWSCSGNGPTAIHLLANHPKVKAGIFLYSYMADLDGHKLVSDTARQFGFCSPESNTGLLIKTTPLFIVRADKDEFNGLNETMDRYVSALQGQNPDVEFINYRDGVHGFDLVDSSSESVQIIRRLLAYLKEKLAI